MAKNAVPDSYKWQLVEAFRLRSQQAADYLRALLFAMSAGAIAFIANQSKLGWLQGVAILLFAFGIASLVYSWDVQKAKSIERMKKIRDEGYESYIKYEKEMERPNPRANYLVDRLAYCFITAGAVVEFVALFKC